MNQIEFEGFLKVLQKANDCNEDKWHDTLLLSFVMISVVLASNPDSLE